MSKHTTPANLTTRLLEHQAKVLAILHGNHPVSGRHRAETVKVSA